MRDESSIRLRPEYFSRIWSYDFVDQGTDDGRTFRTLNSLDQRSRDCFATPVKRKLNSTVSIDALTDLFMLRGVSAHIRKDNGPEFISEAVRSWITEFVAKTAWLHRGRRARDIAKKCPTGQCAEDWIQRDFLSG